MATRLPQVVYDGRLMTEDAAAKGLGPKDLARLTKGRIGLRTVYRFLSGEVQTLYTAKHLAKAIGFPVSRYIVRSRTLEEAVAS